MRREAILEMPISTVVSTVPATTDQFMFTEDFKRLLVGLVVGDTLMILRLATKAWKRVVDAFIDEGMRSGEFIVHDGEDIGFMGAWMKEKAVYLSTNTCVVDSKKRWAETHDFYFQ